MVKLDHITIFVSDEGRSKEWYTSNFGFQVEFEVPDRGTVALVDDADVSLFLVRDENISGEAKSCILTLQVDSVEDKYSELTNKGLHFASEPQKLYWGYGAELDDPDGYRLYLWDEISMSEKGGGT